MVDARGLADSVGELITADLTPIPYLSDPCHSLLGV
jgi:hypothetical protein